ncbi:MAG TPA: zf-HC2 domain-containing protein [Terriglobia bacterium]|nr:zf-HC2 domain-containing protein [Terriglobia bacterium]
MNCKDALQQITGYLDGNVDDELKRMLQVHLKCCHHCQVVFDTTKKTIELYCDGKLFPLPSNVRERLHDALRSKWEARSK